MIKNGFLQQNAFDDIDVFSVPEKQILILELMIQFYKRSLSVIKQGAPLMKITNLPVKEEIVRIKTSVANDKITEISTVESHLEEQLGSLEKIYRKADVL
jgi:V/A-type H+-transporting ATPase subunit A